MTCIRGKPLLKMFDSFNLAKKKNGKIEKYLRRKKSARNMPGKENMTKAITRPALTDAEEDQFLRKGRCAFINANSPTLRKTTPLARVARNPRATRSNNPNTTVRRF